MVISAMEASSAPAPATNSPSAAQSASFATTVRMPVLPCTEEASGTLCQFKLLEKMMSPVSLSGVPGLPMPMLFTSAGAKMCIRDRMGAQESGQADEVGRGAPDEKMHVRVGTLAQRADARGGGPAVPVQAVARVLAQVFTRQRGQDLGAGALAVVVVEADHASHPLSFLLHRLDMILHL